MLPTPPSQLGDISRLDILLIGPQNTPYEGGLWRISLAANIDNDDLTVTFRTRIWHPNVAERSGKTKCAGKNIGDVLSVCYVSPVERNVLTYVQLVRSLLIQPNPCDILNSKAGKLLDTNPMAFEEQAHLLTRIHAPIPSEYAAMIRNMQIDDTPEVEIEFYVDETATDAAFNPDAHAGVLLEILADEIMEDICDKENTCNSNSNIIIKTRQTSLSPLGKRPLEDVWEDPDMVCENVMNNENMMERHNETRKSPKLDEKRLEGMNASGRIRATEEEQDRLQKRREKEKDRKVLAAKKTGVKKGLRRL